MSKWLPIGSQQFRALPLPPPPGVNTTQTNRRQAACGRADGSPNSKPAAQKRKRPSIKTTIRPIPSLSCLEATPPEGVLCIPRPCAGYTLSLGAHCCI